MLKYGCAYPARTAPANGAIKYTNIPLVVIQPALQTMLINMPPHATAGLNKPPIEIIAANVTPATNPYTGVFRVLMRVLLSKSPSRKDLLIMLQ